MKCLTLYHWEIAEDLVAVEDGEAKVVKSVMLRENCVALYREEVVKDEN